MKKKLLSAGILSLALAFGLAVLGCPSGASGGGNTAPEKCSKGGECKAVMMGLPGHEKLEKMNLCSNSECAVADAETIEHCNCAK